MVRAAMVADISAHRHRGHLVAPVARRELRALFRALPALQRALERQLDEWLDRAGTDWQQRLQNLCLTVGVGTLSALQLLAYLPERGARNRRQIAKLPGARPAALGRRPPTRRAPHPTWSLPRPARALSKRGCRRRLDTARWNNVLRPHYPQLRARGKPAKVASIAVARKPVICLNALLPPAGAPAA
jgi:transposase